MSEELIVIKELINLLPESNIIVKPYKMFKKL
jgi:hypothetical protein